MSSINTEKLIKKLTEQFGDRVKVRSQYHVQVDSSKGPHDIYINKFGEIKFRRAGNRTSIENANVEQILLRIESNQKSYLDKMRETFDLARFINQCERQPVIDAAIFTDAGFKDSKARIAAVFVNKDGEVEAKSKLIQAENAAAAELAAINLGLSMHESVTVYNDCQSVVSNIQNDRVKWLSRTENKMADQIGNLRRK